MRFFTLLAVSVMASISSLLYETFNIESENARNSNSDEQRHAIERAYGLVCGPGGHTPSHDLCQSLNSSYKSFSTEISVHELLERSISRICTEDVESLVYIMYALPFAFVSLVLFSMILNCVRDCMRDSRRAARLAGKRPKIEAKDCSDLNEPDGFSCRLCDKRRYRVYITGCGHGNLCPVCMDVVKTPNGIKCPICQEVDTDVFRTFVEMKSD